MGYNCDPVNDPSENKFPYSIYGLLGLAGAKRKPRNLRTREYLFCKLSFETPRRNEKCPCFSSCDIDCDLCCLCDIPTWGVLFCLRLVLAGRYQRMNFGDGDISCTHSVVLRALYEFLSRMVMRSSNANHHVHRKLLDA